MKNTIAKTTMIGMINEPNARFITTVDVKNIKNRKKHMDNTNEMYLLKIIILY